ncbi:Colicin V production protein [Candidatus Sulfopaludibacter sp. SbA4]|nr:Colicin V production protein [Candidatus Sulfopaludibacter sp. SbA4]
MNWLDAVLLFILAASIVTSFRKGLTREVIGLGSVVVALILGIELYGSAGSLVASYVSTPEAANFAGFFLVFFGVLLLGAVVSYILGKFLRVTGLSFVDHALGAGFGAVRGLLIAVALIMGIMAFSPSNKAPESVVESRTAPYMVDAARAVAAVAPHELKESFRKSYAEVKTIWQQTLDKGIPSGPKTEKGNNERKI